MEGLCVTWNEYDVSCFQPAILGSVHRSVTCVGREGRVRSWTLHCPESTGLFLMLLLRGRGGWKPAAAYTFIESSLLLLRESCSVFSIKIVQKKH